MSSIISLVCNLFPLLSLKIKVILLAKSSLFENSRTLPLWQACYSKSNKQDQQTKNKKFVLQTKKKLRAVVLNESPLEKSKISGWWQHLIGWVDGVVRSLWEIQGTSFLWGPVIADSLLLMIILLGSIIDRPLGNGPWVVLLESSPFWAPDSVLVRLSFIKFHPPLMDEHSLSTGTSTCLCTVLYQHDNRAWQQCVLN